ncbi:hypothetical protein [Novosphingobium percolationis]|uniref:hypothetical protein n=1 Tax=Novosphingobium percolationis TaxID=2871811 RepID=UPI001CD26973|nr:hypothetical protein [Novosphingobium percolationis]
MKNLAGKNFAGTILSGALLLASPAMAGAMTTPPSSLPPSSPALPAPLDFHLFEADLARTGQVESGAAQVREAIPAGTDARVAVAMLRAAGASCQSPDRHPEAVGCYYRETIGAEQYLRTYATWDMTLSIADGKVRSVAMARSTEQRS